MEYIHKVTGFCSGNMLETEKPCCLSHSVRFIGFVFLFSYLDFPFMRKEFVITVEQKMGSLLLNSFIK